MRISDGSSDVCSSDLLVENTISQIRESKADKEQTREARRRLKEVGGRLTAGKDSTGQDGAGDRSAAGQAASTEIVPGRWVKLPGSDAKGEVIAASRGNGVIAVGNIRTLAKLHKLATVMGQKMAGRTEDRS